MSHAAKSQPAHPNTAEDNTNDTWSTPMTGAPEVPKRWRSERKSYCSIGASYLSSQEKQMQTPTRPIYLEFAHSTSMELKMSKQFPRPQINGNIILTWNAFQHK